MSAGLEPHSQYSDYATGWTIQGTNLNRDKTFFCSPKCPDRLWGLPSLLFNEYHGSFLDTDRMGCAVDDSPLSSAEVKNECSCTSSATICLRGTHRYSFTLTSVACGEKYKSLCNFLQFFLIPFSHLNILLSTDSRQKGCSQKLMYSATCLQWVWSYRHFKTYNVQNPTLNLSLLEPLQRIIV
jgi:hypothetical protein